MTQQSSTVRSRTVRALAAACFLAGAPLVAHAEAGDILWRVGVTGVFPKSDNNPVVSVDDGYSLSTTVSYFYTDNWAVDVLAAWPFTHDITLNADGSTVGETQHLPPTLSIQYHFAPDAQFRPYVGVGVNYTFFFQEELSGALAGSKLDLDGSFGFAGTVGADFMVSDRMSINAEARWIGIETEAKVDGASIGDVSIDPWVVGVSLGWRF
jgi:outer membrane protein